MLKKKSMNNLVTLQEKIMYNLPFAMIKRYYMLIKKMSLIKNDPMITDVFYWEGKHNGKLIRSVQGEKESIDKTHCWIIHEF